MGSDSSLPCVHIHTHTIPHMNTWCIQIMKTIPNKNQMIRPKIKCTRPLLSIFVNWLSVIEKKRTLHISWSCSSSLEIWKKKIGLTTDKTSENVHKKHKILYIYQIIMLYMLNLYSVICQFYINKTRKKNIL